MSDKQLMVLSTLEDIQFSLELIIKRFVNIKSSDDFLVDENGLEKLIVYLKMLPSMVLTIYWIASLCTYSKQYDNQLSNILR